jgi:DHA1 family tetracycline resistance protein-like MFS transporter
MNAQPPPNGLAQPVRRRAALLFIFLTVLFDVIAFGIIGPVLPKLVVTFLGGRTADAAAIFGIFGTVFALMQFVCSPILGILSDRFGRRPVLLASTFGSVIDFCVMALAPTLGWLFVGRVVSGATTASFPIAGAYIADITPPEKRTAGFSMIWAAFGLGFVIGPAIGGVLGDINPRLPFWVAAGVALANFLYGTFVLPESLPAERRSTRLAWERANPVGSLRFLRAHRDLLSLAATGFLSFLAQQALPNIFVLYGIFRFGWSTRTIGLTLAMVGLSQLIVSGGLVARIVPRIGERAAALAGLALGAAGFLIYAFSAQGWQFWIGIPIMAFWGLAASVQSMMTHRVPPTAQGELQGALNSVRGIGMLVAPSLFTLTLAYFIGPGIGWHLPGAPWFLAAVLLLAALTLAWRYAHPLPASQEESQPAPVEEPEPAVV